MKRSQAVSTRAASSCSGENPELLLDNGPTNNGNGNKGGNGNDGNDNNDGFFEDDGEFLHASSGLIGILLLGLFLTNISIMSAKWVLESDITKIKRLLREIFAEFVKTKGRIIRLEDATGLPSGELITDATPLEIKSSNTTRPSPSIRKQPLSGALKLGGGILWTDDDATDIDADGLQALQASGIRLGTDLTLQLGSSVRNGADSIVAEININPADETFVLEKVIYNCKIANGLRCIASPFGSKGQDVAYTLNPFASSGLTSIIEKGNPLHQRLLGSVVGFAADLPRAWATLAFFSNGTEGSSTNPSDVVLAQAVIAPMKAFSFGFSVLEPRGTISQLLTHVASRSATTSDALTSILSQGQEGRRIGCSFALASGGGGALHGWATTGAKALANRSFEEYEWGLALGPQPDGSGNGWVLGMGKVPLLGGATATVVPPSTDGSSGDLKTVLQPNVLEASTQINLGDGLCVTPGVVMMRRRGRNTLFAGLKTAWMF